MGAVQAMAPEHTHLVIDKSGKWEVVEKVCKVLPYIGVSILSQALIVESVHLCDLPRLVVSSEDGDTIAIADLECY